MGVIGFMRILLKRVECQMLSQMRTGGVRRHFHPARFLFGARSTPSLQSAGRESARTENWAFWNGGCYSGSV